MTQDEGGTPEFLETAPAADNNFSFTQEEVDFLLDRLETLKKSDSIDETEEELADFLIEQLSKLAPGEKNEYQQEEELEAVAVNSQSADIKEVKKMLNNRLGEFIVLTLMVGGDCCQVKGVLCDIASDFVTLIDQELVIEVKINQIAAISKTADMGFKSETDCYSHGEECQMNNTANNLPKTNQSSSEEGRKAAPEEETIAKEGEQVEEGTTINKRERIYTHLEE